MPITYTVEDCKDPIKLERVLRQFETAIQNAERVPAPPSAGQLVTELAPAIRQQLQAGGIAPLNLQSLLPSAGTGTTLADTHANRLAIYPPSNYPVGTLFYETDRTVVYAVATVAGVSAWKYIAGMYANVFANRPLDLGPNDANFLFWVIIQAHVCRWSGNVWTIVDGGGGYIVDSIVPMGIGYALCDGTATDYLTISGTDLAETAITPADETGAPAGVYHASIATYTGTINAASGGGVISGATSTDNLDPTTDLFALDAGGSAAVTGFDEPHAHNALGLTVTGSGEPRNLGVLRYFRR